MKGLDKDYAKMRRDLIVAIDEVNNLKEKAKVLLDNLRVERQMMLGEGQAAPGCKGKGEDDRRQVHRGLPID